MSKSLYRRSQFGCVCGHVSRSASEEARHRHNFPIFCRKPKQTRVKDDTISCRDFNKARDEEDRPVYGLDD